MIHNAINPNISLGFVTLRVQDLQRSIAFYTEIIGFTVISNSTSAADLGAGERTLLRLIEESGARPAPRTAGLYHFAILVSSRRELARSIQQLVMTRIPLQGFADHLVSEAVYLADPDGNGIEIYRDRPRDQWPRRDGQLLMATDPLDVNRLLSELGSSPEQWTGLAQETRIGHIHLQVSNLEQAIAFYQDRLGLDLVMRYGPSAAFLSAGGYHHHIGINTWAGTGIPAAPSDATGLVMYSIDLPDLASFERYMRSPAIASLSFEQIEDGQLTLDPSGNSVLIRPAGD
jgi:catechol 2,3-dioxygenase